MSARFRRRCDTLLNLLISASWPWFVGVLAALFSVGAVLMPQFEGTSSPFANLADYSWWFVVTSTTVGYGDIAPASVGGRVTAVVIMLFGIGVIAAAAARVAESMIELGRRRMMGHAQLAENNHLVVLGYCVGETEHLVQELLADESEADRAIVLCANKLEHNPMPDHVRFVSGDLTCVETLRRACVARAERILVHCCDDNETLVVALAARSVNPQAHLVAVVARHETETHLKRVCPNIEVVSSLAVPMMVQSIQDPGATAVVSALLSNALDDTIFSLRAPDNGQAWSFGSLQRSFKDRLGATLIAMSSAEAVNGIKLNPLATDPVPPGASLFYIAPKRIVQAQATWEAL